MSSETDADGGYVHTPDDAPDGGDAGPATDADRSASVDAADPAGRPGDSAEPAADGFGRKGWALTAVLFTCVLVIPGIIYAYPYVPGAFGFTFFATYLALPLVPAVLLGLVAVWSMTAATE
ncbi:hypothetical protein ACFPM1_15285 [Halorubrum rubrum]|uniref:Cox cluster protein n=1 Tax=Halorubrum rubrum TaxID=1126240 RepID=A0ABD5R581_9EURY|nr:hypothetical protein [Halorubrum rubrum]